MSDKLRIVSLNTRGLRNDIKRRKMFRYGKLVCKADVFFMQETHGDSKVEKLWTNEYGNRVLYANGASNAKGVAIGLNKKLANNIDNIQCNINGRYILITCKFEGLSYCLCNIYAPNNDDPDWFGNLFELVKQQECIYTVIGGDFNTIMDKGIDRSSRKIFHPRANQKIKEKMEEMNLVDIWRSRNEDRKTFTWMNKNEGAWSRIDYFLISDTLCVKCEETKILPAICTDHSSISLTVNISENKRGPGVWKLNNELLEDQNFNEQMTNVLKGCIRSFSYLDVTNFWEVLKFEAANFAKNFAKERTENERVDKFKLYKSLGMLQEQVVKSDKVPRGILDNIEQVKMELDAYSTRDAQRAAFRCRQQWVQHGERSSKYYFGLEKRNAISKTMYIAKRQDGSLTKDYTEILNIRYRDIFDFLKTPIF